MSTESSQVPDRQLAHSRQVYLERVRDHRGRPQGEHRPERSAAQVLEERRGEEGKGEGRARTVLGRKTECATTFFPRSSPSSLFADYEHFPRSYLYL